MLNRRALLQAGWHLGLGASLLGLGGCLARSPQGPLLLSARTDARGRHHVCAAHLDGRMAFALPVEERCHGIGVHPSRPLAVFSGRRPSRQGYLVDLQRGRILQQLDTPPDRHFNGHGVFHHREPLFYTTENDTRHPGEGRLGRWVLDGERLRRLDDLSTHGIGPHELIWMPDGETLAIGNGGIRTEAESRRDMNLDHMDASLVLMDRHGPLISRDRLPERQNSIRHLAVAADGTLVAIQQYMGDPDDLVQLVAIKRPGQPLTHFLRPEQELMAMRQYTASAAIHSDLRLLAVTAPRGNRLFVWHLDRGDTLLDTHFPDGAGVAAVADGFVGSSGQSHCRHWQFDQDTVRTQVLPLPQAGWDNHWQTA